MNLNRSFRFPSPGIALTLLLLALAVSTARAGDSTLPADKHLQDNAGEDYQWRFVLADTSRDRFEQTFDNRSDRRYEVSRVCVELGNYDGPPGYTAILIRSLLIAGPGIRTELMTAFPAGQYRLCLFELDGFKIYAYELEQRGSGVYITGLRIFSPDKLDGERIGPRGIYQYASCNPAGTYCLLVDADITIYDFQAGNTTRMSDVEQIKTSATSQNAIGGFNLSGEFMEMKWLTETVGTLILRDETGKVQREIDIDFETIVVD